MPNAVAWDNRIVEYAPAVPLESLLFHPQNPKIHPRAQTEAIKGIIGEVGWLTGLLVNIRTSHVLDGHDRIKAAMEDGQLTAPVFYLDVPEEMEPYVLATFDPVGTLAATDSAILTDLLREVSSEDSAVQALLASLVTAPEAVAPGAGGDEFDATPGAGETRVQPGDLWAMGEHRLLCGDSTDPDAVARLMGTERADCVFTSPPYNSGDGGYKTDYHGKTKRFYVSNTDDRTEDEWIDFCCSVLTVLATVLRDTACPVIWNVMYTARCRKGYGRVVFGDSQPFKVQETICWDKSTNFPSASKGILSRTWELIFVLCQIEDYFSTQGLHEVRYNKWDIPAGTQGEEHKATFPVALPERALADFSTKGQIVLDPFIGSGTTLIAAHRTGRVAYGLEIEPRYCDVILRRAEAEGIGPIVRVAP